MRALNVMGGASPLRGNVLTSSTCLTRVLEKGSVLESNFPRNTAVESKAAGSVWRILAQEQQVRIGGLSLPTGAIWAVLLSVGKALGASLSFLPILKAKSKK